jgi:hypothetical protein
MRSFFVLCVTAILVIVSTVGVRADLNSKNPDRKTEKAIDEQTKGPFERVASHEHEVFSTGYSRPTQTTRGKTKAPPRR